MIAASVPCPGKETLMAFYDDFKNGWAGFMGNPVAFAKVMTTALLVISFSFLLFSWLFMSAASQKSALGLFGIMVLLMCVVGSEKGFPLTAAVLIVGTIVAQEDFLLKISHMWAPKSGTDVSHYLSQGRDAAVSKETQRAAAVETSADAISKKISETVSSQVDKAVDQAVTKIVERLNVQAAPLKVQEVTRDIKQEIKQATTQNIAAQTKRQVKTAITDDALRTETKFWLIENVLEKKTTFKDHNRRWGNIEAFQNDVKLLRERGLLECKGNDIDTCQPTDLAVRVHKSQIKK